MLVTSLTACGEKKEETTATATPAATTATTEAATANGELKDGTFEGTGKGNNGDIKVSVTVKEGKITEVKVLEHKETVGICEKAIENLPAAIIEKQSAEVDAIATATMTSNGIKEAVTNALASK